MRVLRLRFGKKKSLAYSLGRKFCRPIHAVAKGKIPFLHSRVGAHCVNVPQDFHPVQTIAGEQAELRERGVEGRGRIEQKRQSPWTWTTVW